MRTEITVRFGYGNLVPWVSRRQDGRLQFTAGPDRLLLDTAVLTRGEGLCTVGAFTVREGENASFVLNWSPVLSRGASAPVKRLNSQKLPALENVKTPLRAAEFEKDMKSRRHCVLTMQPKAEFRAPN